MIDMYVVENFTPGRTEDGETKWTPFNLTFPSVCSIRFPLDKLTTDVDNYAKLVVAHELYHCVEWANDKPSSPAEPPRIEDWWREGVAEFFGNFFYPDKDPDANIRNYVPNKPLYQQRYETAVFFQFLNNAGWYEQQVNSWMVAQQLSPDTGAERARVSQDVDLRAQFPKFATHLSTKASPIMMGL
jgi:hypothetical protein